MATGKKTGGRKAGTPNKRTQAVIDKLEGLGCDPIEGMARIAQQSEEEGDKALAARMYTELAPYVAPKRKAVEVTNKEDWEGRTREEMEAEYNAARKAVIEEFMALPESERLAFLETEH